MTNYYPLIILVSVLSYYSITCQSFSFDIIDNSFAKVSIGNPSQELLLFIDPSSLVSVLFEQRCDGCNQNRNNYIPRTNTLKKSHIFYSFNTIFGTYNGTIVNEHINFDKNSMKMYFLLVYQTNAIAVDCDGILGLGQLSDSLEAFSKMSFINELYRQHQIQPVFVIDDWDTIHFGIEKAMNGDSNGIEIIMDQTDLEYPTMNSNYKGLSCFNRIDMTSDPQLFMDIIGPVTFTLAYDDNMPHVTFPIKERQFFSHYFHYLLKDEKQLKDIKPDKANNIELSYSGVYNLDEYVSALIIQNNFLKYSSSNETNTDKSSILDIAFTEQFNYTFFTLNQLIPKQIVFNYNKNTLSLYNGYGCQYDQGIKSSFWVFTSIFTFSGGCITLLLILLSMRDFSNSNDVNNNLLKSYNIII